MHEKAPATRCLYPSIKVLLNGRHREASQIDARRLYSDRQNARPDRLLRFTVASLHYATDTTSSYLAVTNRGKQRTCVQRAACSSILLVSALY